MSTGKGRPNRGQCDQSIDLVRLVRWKRNRDKCLQPSAFMSPPKRTDFVGELGQQEFHFTETSKAHRTSVAAMASVKLHNSPGLALREHSFFELHPSEQNHIQSSCFALKAVAVHSKSVTFLPVRPNGNRHRIFQHVLLDPRRSITAKDEITSLAPIWSEL